MAKMRLALIAGGKSSEREVSLKSGAQVYEALDKSKYDIRRYDPLDRPGQAGAGRPGTPGGPDHHARPGR